MRIRLNLVLHRAIVNCWFGLGSFGRKIPARKLFLILFFTQRGTLESSHLSLSEPYSKGFSKKTEKVRPWERPNKKHLIFGITSCT